MFTIKMNYNNNLIVELSSKILSFACSPPAFCLREKREKNKQTETQMRHVQFFFHKSTRWPIFVPIRNERKQTHAK